jgi:hypothetical protein
MYYELSPIQFQKTNPFRVLLRGASEPLCESSGDGAYGLFRKDCSMKKLIGFVFLSLVIGCVSNPSSVNYPIKTEAPIEMNTKVDTLVEVLHSFGIRESKFKGIRNNIVFGIDTLPYTHFNGTSEGYGFWCQYIGKIWSDTSTCYYGEENTRWLDTFYFSCLITDVKINGYEIKEEVTK